MLKQVNVRINGVSPLICHNGQTANPLNKFAKAMKEISAKRQKTDSDYEKMALVEWNAGLYLNVKGEIIIPGVCIEAAMLGGAKQSKLGVKSKAGLFVDEDPVLEHDGSKDIKALSEDANFIDTRAVRIGQAKVMRTRPIFRTWALTFVLNFDDSVLQLSQVEKSLEDAGKLVGIGDYRPKFGRFSVEKFEIVK